MPTGDSQEVADQQPARGRRWASGLSGAALFVLALVLINVIGIGLAHFLPWLQSLRRSGAEAQQGVGQRLTFLELRPLTGDPPPLSSSDLEGNVVLLNFWGTWCPPCRVELPHMAALYNRFANRSDFRLAAISLPGGGDGNATRLREETAALLKQLRLDLPTYYDPDSKTLKALAGIVDFTGVPTNVLIDRKGVIRAVWVGYQPGVEREIESYADKLLSET